MTGGHNASPESWPVDQCRASAASAGPPTSHSTAGRSPCQRIGERQRRRQADGQAVGLEVDTQPRGGNDRGISWAACSSDVTSRCSTHDGTSAGSRGHLVGTWSCGTTRASSAADRPPPCARPPRAAPGPQPRPRRTAIWAPDRANRSSWVAMSGTQIDGRSPIRTSSATPSRNVAGSTSIVVHPQRAGPLSNSSQRAAVTASTIAASGSCNRLARCVCASQPRDT